MRFWTTLLALLAAVSLVACQSNKETLGPQLLKDDGGTPNQYNQLSSERINEIRRHFIGRHFVFKTDWYQFMRIDSDPHGGFGDPVPDHNFSDSITRQGADNRLVATAGTAAKITGVRIFKDGLAFIAKIDGGAEAYLVILHNRPQTLAGRHRHSKTRETLDDDNTTVAWLEEQLTYRTVSFAQTSVATISPISSSPASMALPAPTPEPTLTPVPGASLPTSNAVPGRIERVTATANPASIARGGTLQLQLDYGVSGESDAQVIERRTLSFGGQVLPGYPRERTLQRDAGRQSSAITQSIPIQAASGTYLYRGEVCIDGKCAVDEDAFEVLAR